MKKFIIFLIFLIFFSFHVFTNEDKSLNEDFNQNNLLNSEEQVLDNNDISLGDTLSSLQETLVTQNKSPILKPTISTTSLNFSEVFKSSPTIYSLLLIMSITSFSIFLYSLFSFRLKELISPATVTNLKNTLLNKDYERTLTYCNQNKNLLSAMIASGISIKEHNVEYVIDTIKNEGKRATASIWQKINLLHEIAILAPMLGLLGTVIGMFYAFYDINRSIDSLSSLFDGLGIAVGTTVAGLIVAILAMIFHSILKFKMIKTLNHVENEAVYLGNLIKTKE